MRRILTVFAMLVLALPVPLVRAAPQRMPFFTIIDRVKAQLQVAITLAERGAGATTAEQSRSLLGMVINCLEGPGGAHFNASAGNWCYGKGNGILPDLRLAESMNNPAQALGKPGPNVPGAWKYADAALSRALRARGVADLATLQAECRLVLRDLNGALASLGG